MNITALGLAQKFLGIKEVAGDKDNPLIVAFLSMSGGSDSMDDEVPWCSAFVNFVARLLSLPRSGSLAARSWLKVGLAVPLSEATAGFDVVVLMRGQDSPGADVIAAPGHVGFYVSQEVISGVRFVNVLGGNQGDSVTVARFPAARVLGVRRVA